jgi:hypothetical protein
MGGNTNYTQNDWLATSVCEHCNQATVWHEKAMIYPNHGTAPIHNADMPHDVANDYLEAAKIANLSPKAAAALLRLAIQKLCAHLGGDGKNINDDIARLVKSGLSPLVQQSLDIVRVVGNNAVHPGQIDVDDPEVVNHLFHLLNLITEMMISTPARVKGLYSNLLPQAARDAIAKRDGDD